MTNLINRKSARRIHKTVEGPQARCCKCHLLYPQDQIQFGTFSILKPSDFVCSSCRKVTPGFILYEDLIESPLNIGDF